VGAEAGTHEGASFAHSFEAEPPRLADSLRTVDSRQSSFTSTQSSTARLYTPPVVPVGMNSSLSLSHASPPHALLASRKGKANTVGAESAQYARGAGADGAAGGGASDFGEAADAEPDARPSEDLDLMYDPMLNCYYDPKTNKYYELR